MVTSLFGRITSWWPLHSGGVCVQLQERRGRHTQSWELEVLGEGDLDFDGQRDTLTDQERCFVLGLFLATRYHEE